ncbi:MAG TPA: dihydroneopterin aldolase [Marinagarivorans sp.]
MSADIVFIKGLKTEGVIGVFDWEREIRQPLYVDVEMATDIRRAAKRDELELTLNYKAVCERIAVFVKESQFQLIETLAERLAALLRAEFAIVWLRLSIHKPGAIANAQDIGITIERGDKP